MRTVQGYISSRCESFIARILSETLSSSSRGAGDFGGTDVEYERHARGINPFGHGVRSNGRLFRRAHLQPRVCATRCLAIPSRSPRSRPTTRELRSFDFRTKLKFPLRNRIAERDKIQSKCSMFVNARVTTYVRVPF